MEASVSNEPGNDSSEAVASSAGEKRTLENGENGETEELSVRSPKKLRCGLQEEMKRVAEIVLVLSAMGKMRGGKGPTDAEVKLMAEARAKLVEMCREFAPKDIVGRDAIGAVIEDLGLNGKLKDQRLGFRGPKLTISEKVSLAKRKMDESKKLTAPSTTFTPHPLQQSVGAATERPSHPPIGSATHTVRIIPTDKPSQAPLSSGGFQGSSRPGHVTPAINTSLQHQFHTGEVKAPVVSGGLPGGHFTPRFERSQTKLEGGLNGSTNAAQVTANSSANQSLVNAPTWSIQSQSNQLANSAAENKRPIHTPSKVEGSADLNLSHIAQPARDQSFRPFITQTTSGNFSGVNPAAQNMGFVQTNNHNEIAKIVQKLLHPQLPHHPTWNPPSREYMNKALTCQMCKVTINDVEAVLICDACEKGFHLKCLQAANLKGIPKLEWHCTRCLHLCNGKLPPPKYGRVMRSMIAPKVPSNTGVMQLSSEKKISSLDSQDNQHKIKTNGNPGLQSPAGPGTMSSNFSEPISDPRALNSREMQGSNLSSSKSGFDQNTISATCPSTSTKSLEASGPTFPSNGNLNPPSQIAESYSHEEKSISESENAKSQPPAMSVGTHDHSQPSQNTQYQSGIALGKEIIIPDSEHTNVRQDDDNISRMNERQQGVAQENPTGSSGPWTDDGKHDKVTSEGSHGVEWIGDVRQVVDGRKSYQSCRINGIIYKVQDHALLRSSQDKLIPMKLQAMWEDLKTGSKWVVVNRCYFPADLPEAVRSQSDVENNEVYDSNSNSTIMASLIQGPCEVLPATKFKDKNERRMQLGTEANRGLPPVFHCKGFYDEFRGTLTIF